MPPEPARQVLSPSGPPLGLLTLDDLSLARKRVLVRVDFNVPLSAGVVQDDARIRACLPTLRRLLAAEAGVIIVSHLGRPRPGHHDDSCSLAPVAERLSALLGRETPLIADWEVGLTAQPGALVMLENIRFTPGETTNDPELARRLASLCDVYVNDAFATAHRAQASTHGVAKHAPAACAGPLLLAEITALSKALEAPRRPLVAIVGGAKVSTKLTALKNLVKKVDQLVVGGGIANTFLRAAGQPIGNSLHEADLAPAATAIRECARDCGMDIPLPIDAVCAKTLAEDAVTTVKPIAEIAPDDLIGDVGPKTIAANDRIIRSAGTVLWNGPLGVFELGPFARGTAALARAIAANPGFSIAGGGDTLSAAARFGVTQDLSYISTGGGAFLEFLEGETLPAIAVLQEAAGWRAKRA